MKKLIKYLLPTLMISLLLMSILLTQYTDVSGMLGSAVRFLDIPLGHQQVPEEDKIVLGGSYTLKEGEILDGSLFILGGTARLSTGSIVNRDILILGGTLIAEGEIKGDVNALGGLVTLESDAHVAGDINTLSATLQREEGARIDGELNQITEGPFSLFIPGNLNIPGFQGVPSITIPGEGQSPALSFQLNPLWDFLWWLIRSLVWAALAVLISLFIPNSVMMTSRAAVTNPIVSGGMGLLTVLVAPLLLILLAITICGIPISLLGGFLLWLAWGLGLVAIGLETGSRLAGLLKVDWALPVSSGLGTMILTLVSNGIGLLIPCIGWLVSVSIGVLGLGAVILTRFGTRTFPINPIQTAARPVESPVQSDEAKSPETSEGELNLEDESEES